MQTPQDQPVHATRSAPQCRNCLHIHRKQSASGFHFVVDDCNHPSAAVSLISGEPESTCIEMREGACGPNGLWFKAVSTSGQPGAHQGAGLGQAD